jgi:DNA replication protein DnaC
MSDRLAALMQRAGIDPDTPIDNPTPDNVNAWQVDLVTERLKSATPVPFHGFQHPPIAAVRAWVGEYLQNPNAGTPLVLIGLTGTGKTYNAWWAMCTAVIQSYRRRRSVTWGAVSHPTFNAETRPAADNSHAATLRRYSERDLLIFDDLGASKGTDWSVECLLRLMDDRFAAGLPTIWTTNVKSTDELTKKTDDRIVSRLHQATWVHFGAVDFRKSS